MSFLIFPAEQMILGFFLPILVIVLNSILMAKVFGYKWKGGIDWNKTLLEFPIGVLAVLVFIAGEEIGWRGFLQQPMVGQLGPVPGIILLGIVWELWHAPVALRGYNLQSNFLAETYILYPFMCVCFISHGIPHHSDGEYLASTVISRREQRAGRDRRPVLR